MAASGVELATAYISLVPSFKGARAKLGQEFGDPLEQEADRAGQQAGKKAGNSFGDAFSGAVGGIVGTAALWGGGTLLANGFNEALAEADLPGALQVQYRLAEPAAAEAAASAGRVYAQGFGASLDEVGKTAANVTRALDNLGSSENIDRLTVQAQALASEFGEEVEPLIRAAQKAVSAGLAPSLEDAFDVLAVGLGNGANEAGDLLDTFSEYSTQFRNMGLDAKTALGLMTQGLANSARDADTVADALKEFSIEAVAGADRVRGGYESLGVDADKMFAQMAKGGPAAARALDFTLDRLRAVKDPVERNAIAIELFGTKAEDLGTALYSLDPSAAVEALGEVSGAAQGAADTVGDRLTTQLSGLGVALNTAVGEAIAPMIPVLHEVLAALKPYMPVIGPIVIGLAGLTAATWLWNAGLGAVLKVGWKVLNWAGKLVGMLGALIGRTIAAAGAFLGKMVAAIVTTTFSMLRYLVVQTMVVARTVAGWILMGAQALLAAARIAAAWLIALGPIGIVIAAVIALVTAIVLYFDEIVAAISAAWTWIQEAATAAWDWIVGIVVGAVEGLVNLFLNWTLPGLVIKHWDTIVGVFTRAGAAIVNALRTALGWIGDRWNQFAGFVGRVAERVRGFFSNMWNGLVEGAKGAANFAIRIINGLIGVANKAIGGLNMVPGINIALIPQIPYLAEGGITTGPTVAMIGEGKEQEAVMPLSKLDALLANRGSGAPVVKFDLTGDRHLVAWLRSVVRTQGGGSVQAALGRG